MTELLSQPSAPGGGIDLNTYNGSLLLITVLSVEHKSNQFSKGELVDCVRCDVDVLDGAHKGDELADVLLWPKVIIGQLRAHVGGKVIGRLTQGEAKPGQNPAWLLADATDADIAVGRAYLAGSAVAATPPF